MVEQILDKRNVDIVIVKTSKRYAFDKNRFDDLKEVRKENSDFMLISNNPLFVNVFITNEDPTEPNSVDFHGEKIPKDMVEMIEIITKDDNPDLSNNPSLVQYDVDSDLTLPYYENAYPDDNRTALYLKQRKLLMSEVYFISKYSYDSRHGDSPIDILYVGAATGDHIPYLYSLFEEIDKFYLYDPNRFTIERGENIIIHDTLFTNNDAQRWSNRKKPFLFICNAKTGLEDNDIHNDLRSQKQWYEIMKKNTNMIAAMLRFQLPFSYQQEDDKITYFSGNEIFFPCWNSQTSNESRIIVTNNPISLRERSYSIIHYEQSFNYLNDVTREWQWFNHRVPIGVSTTPTGLDHCYDCSLEVLFWTEYLESRGESITSGKLASLINNTSHEEMQLYRPPHGSFPTEHMINKRRKLIKETEQSKTDEQKK